MHAHDRVATTTHPGTLSRARTLVDQPRLVGIFDIQFVDDLLKEMNSQESLAYVVRLSGSKNDLLSP